MAEEETEKPEVTGVGAVVIPTPVVSGTAKSRTNLAVQHISASAYSSRKAGEIETVNAGKAFGDFYEEIVWNVSAAVFFAIAALEGA